MVENKRGLCLALYCHYLTKYKESPFEHFKYSVKVYSEFNFYINLHMKNTFIMFVKVRAGYGFPQPRSRDALCLPSATALLDITLVEHTLLQTIKASECYRYYPNFWPDLYKTDDARFIGRITPAACAALE